MRKIIYSLIILAVFNNAFSQVPNYVPKNGLLGWWPFTGNALDSSGNANHGTITGATLTTDRGGRSNQAYNFDGNDFIQITQKSNFNFDTNSFSISCWGLKTGSNTFQTMVERHFVTSWPNAIASFCLRFEGSSGNGITGWAAGVDGNNNAVLTHTSGSVTYSNWNHYVIVYNNLAKLMSLYINGIHSKTINIRKPPLSFTTTGNLFFGVEQPFVSMPSGPAYLTGKLDDIGIWSRALDPCEIAGLYQAKVVSPKPSSVSIGSNTQSYCGKDSVKITATSGFKSYAWSNGKTGSSIFVKSTGTYTIAATDSQGCTVFDTAVISVLNPKISPRDTVVCNSNAVKLSVRTQSASIGCSAPTGSLASGLVGWWPFCGNANDVSGSGNHGKVYGAALTNDRNGISNGAYQFNGSNNYIDILGTNGLSSSKGISLAAWFKWEGPNGVNNHQYIYLIAPNPNASIVIEDSGYLGISVLNCNCGNDVTAKTKILKNKWYHVSLTYDLNTGTMKLYLNSKLISSIVENMYSYYTTNNPADRFGNYHFNSHYFKGSLDECGLWNRELTENEVKNLYSNINYQWSNLDTLSTTTSNALGKSTVWVKVSNGIGSCYDTTTVRIQKPTVSMGKDTQSYCRLDSALINANSGFASYNWSNGKKGASVYANATGPISVTATDSFGCTATDDALISVQNPRILPRDTIVCSGQAVTLRVKDTTGGINACATLSGSLKSGLVGWWPFCGNANDESGNGNHASSYGGAALTTDRFGNKNGAYLFDGINDYLQGKFNNFPLGKEARSVAAWVKFNTKANLYENFLTSWGLGTASQSSAGQGFGVYVSMKLSFLELWPSFTPTPQNNLRHNYTFDSGKFYHIAFTMDSNSNFKFFINSKLVHTSSVIGLNTVSNNGIFRFGRSSHTNTDGWAGYMKGVIDEIGVWNREINNSEITSLFNNFSYNSGIEWSTGDTTFRTRIQTAGTTQVWLKQFNGIGTCYDTTYVRISNPILNVAADTLRFTNCKRDSLRLSVGKKWKSVQWSHGPKDSAVFLKTTGKYSVRVQDSVGCFTADTFNFINPGKVVAQLLSTDSVRCFAESNGKAVVKGTGGFTPLTYKWNDGLSQKTATAVGLKAGTYKAIITDAFGCKDSATAVIREPNKLAIQITAQDSPTCFGYSDGRITSIGTGGNPSYFWKWSGGQTTSAITGLAKGTYKVLLTDRKGCRDSSIVVLGEPAQVIPKIIAGQISMRDEFLSYTTSVTPTGTYVYSWQPSADFGDQANKPDGKIKLSKNTTLLLLVTSPNGCIGRDSLNITVIQPIANILPNAFSPNSDGLNEGFGLPDIFEIKDFVVYDRWGGIIFKGNSASSKWNGKVGNSDATAGTYAYSITAVLKGTNQQVSYTGRVTLIK